MPTVWYRFKHERRWRSTRCDEDERAPAATGSDAAVRGGATWRRIRHGLERQHGLTRGAAVGMPGRTTRARAMAAASCIEGYRVDNQHMANTRANAPFAFAHDDALVADCVVVARANAPCRGRRPGNTPPYGGTRGAIGAGDLTTAAEPPTADDACHGLARLDDDDLVRDGSVLILVRKPVPRHRYVPYRR